jgi:hypothetical protein
MLDIIILDNALDRLEEKIKMDGDVEQWGIFELTLKGPEEGNPFVDVELSAEFKHSGMTFAPEGFYDGEGLYRVRFMPNVSGSWTYITKSNQSELDGIAGQFNCIQPSKGNNGPVRVRNMYHFGYEDGKPFFPVGTTCYAWVHQGEDLERQTLETLKKAPFNKMRFCVFPKHYIFNQNEPVYYPFEGSLSKGWDFSRFNSQFWRHLECRVGDLLQLKIEADLILFHPYDRWGYAGMDPAADERYIKYTVARLAAYRNIWWSLANEYDLMKGKAMTDWDWFFQIIQQKDPYQHLRSVHNCVQFYDHSKRWVTHASIQYQNLDYSTVLTWRAEYRKPVVIDECGYEGNIHDGWGNLTPQELVRRHWEGVARGGYVGHGETYLHPEDLLWWSKGGVLRGESPERIAFLRRILDDGLEEGLEPIDFGWDVACAGIKDKYYLLYFGIHQPVERHLNLPDDSEFKIDILDTWEMTINSLKGSFKGKCKVKLPGKPYIALRICKKAS